MAEWADNLQCTCTYKQPQTEFIKGREKKATVWKKEKLREKFSIDKERFSKQNPM
jgi:hypothetical protein